MSKIIDVIYVLRSFMPNSRVKKVFDKLGKAENRVPLHLKLLNLRFSKDEEKQIFNKLKKLVLELKKSPETISRLIRDPNWRPTLVGNAFVILLKADEFQSDLIWRLEKGSWVAPQIAVGIALVDKGGARVEMEKIIKNASKDSNPKIIMSAYSSLKFLGSDFAHEFKETELFSVLKENDSWDNSLKIAEKHWNYWKEIKF